MVEDGQIKTTVSPFAIREGEIKTFDGKDGYVSINQIINKINLGHISDIHFEVLNLINRLCDKVELLEYNRDKALEYNDYLIRDAKYHLYLVHLKKMKKKIKGDV